MTTETTHRMKKDNQPLVEPDNKTSDHDYSLQKRLIALNAAFEAARAGQAGSEFALLIDKTLHMVTKTKKEDVKDSSICYLL